MSLILIEGFDSVWPGTIEVASRLNRLHPVNDVGGGWKLASGRDGGYSIYCATASTTATMWLYPPGREKNDTWIVGCNVYIRDAYSTVDQWLGLQQASFAGTARSVGLKFGSDYTITVVDNTESVLASSANNVFNLNTWHHIEFKAVCHTSNGEVEVRVDGVPVITANGINTSPHEDSRWSAVMLGAAGSLLYNPFIDDLYVCNDQGSTNNDFLGECYVRTLHPTSDAGPNDGTPSTGTDHYALIDEYGADYNSTYIDLDADSEKEMFGFQIYTGNTWQDLTVNGPILGLSLTSLIGANTAARQRLNQVFKSGASETSLDSKAFPKGGSYYGVHHIAETNPATGSLWTESELNSGEFGFELDAS